MLRSLSLCTLALLFAVPAGAAEIRGQYVEARTCDVWTGPCFANADFNLRGKNAVMAWKIDSGSLNGVELDGLSVVAVVSAHNTLGLEQTSPAKVILIVDRKANSAQREALVQLARKQGGQLLRNVIDVRSADVNVNLCECKNESCAEVTAGAARVRTRCLYADHDKVCGNESAYYPPLAQNVQARAAAVVEHGFTGTGLGETWRDFEGRGAYVGSFVTR